jgi:perosamine synthetase
MYAIELDEEYEISAETMIGLLKERHIGARPFFVGLHAQPVFARMRLFKARAIQTSTGLTSVGCICRLGLP